MSKQDFISVPAVVLNLSPIEIKTYCVLRLAAERPQFDVFSIAESSNIDSSILRLSILTLRLQGFLLINSALSSRLLLDDLENVPIQIIDRQLTINEVIQADPDFINFVTSCLKDFEFIKRWAKSADEEISLANKLVSLANEIAFYLQLPTDKTDKDVILEG